MWLDKLDTDCARAMARWLKGSVNLQRPIKSLTLAELKCMAANASAEWIVQVSKRLASEDKPFNQAEADVYAALLFG